MPCYVEIHVAGFKAPNRKGKKPFQNGNSENYYTHSQHALNMIYTSQHMIKHTYESLLNTLLHINANCSKHELDSTLSIHSDSMLNTRHQNQKTLFTFFAI